MFLFIFFGLTTSIIMSEEKYELLFKWAIKNVNKTTSSELTKYATLIAISVDLENVSPEEQQAFHKVYSKYKKIVAEATEKRKWSDAYYEVARKLQDIDQLTCIPTQEEDKCENKPLKPEQQEFLEYYREIYSQLK